MKTTTQSDRIIFGLKVRQLRQGKQLSFADLSKLANVSVSYLNEIEKGKKYPKEDKITSLSKALDVPYEDLVSSELDSSLAPVTELLQSNFLNELPLDMFGIELIQSCRDHCQRSFQGGSFHFHVTWRYPEIML
jgi:transcriptional regulator with XRE-family HTH domain